jgi:hypothetical protein
MGCLSHASLLAMFTVACDGAGRSNSGGEDHVTRDATTTVSALDANIDAIAQGLPEASLWPDAVVQVMPTANKSCSGAGGAVAPFCKSVLATGTSADYSPIYAAAGAVDPDDRLDLVVFSSTSNSPDVAGMVLASVLRGQSDGLPRQQEATSAAIGNPGAQLLDLNADRRADLSAGNFVAYGIGNGRFEPTVETGASNGVRLWGDLDGDGRPDSFLAAPAGIEVQLNQARGLSLPIRSEGDSSELRYAALVDVDGDAALDLVGVHYQDAERISGAALVVVLGRGDGRFGLPSSFELAGTVAHLIVSDLNCDARADAIWIDDRGSVRLMLRDAQGWPASATSVVALIDPWLDVIEGTGWLAVGELNDDGIPDLVAAVAYRDAAAPSRQQGSLHLLLGVGHGGLALDPLELSGNAPSVANFVLAADFDEDGRSELVAIDPNPEVGPRLELWHRCR